MIAIVKPGLLTTIQDLGRPGYAHLGVARSGALDAPALARANALVGNPATAAGLETTLTGVTLRAEADITIAVTGAVAPITVDGRPVAFDAPVAVPSGGLVEVGRARHGVRSYIAVAGGITVAPVLGSRSTDTLSGLGPPPMRAGFVLPLGKPGPIPVRAPGAAPGTGPVSEPSTLATTPPAIPPTADDADGELTLRIRLGPRHDWFSVPARDALLSEPYVLSVKSNRVGARLTGPSLTRSVLTELPSEGIVLGAVQVPADGQPLIFLADHPTTGGYPVIAVVERADLPLLAQARPGTTIRFALWSGEPPAAATARTDETPVAARSSVAAPPVEPTPGRGTTDSGPAPDSGPATGGPAAAGPAPDSGPANGDPATGAGGVASWT